MGGRKKSASLARVEDLRIVYTTQTTAATGYTAGALSCFLVELTLLALAGSIVGPMIQLLVFVAAAGACALAIVFILALGTTWEELLIVENEMKVSPLLMDLIERASTRFVLFGLFGSIVKHVKSYDAREREAHVGVLFKVAMLVAATGALFVFFLTVVRLLGLVF